MDRANSPINSLMEQAACIVRRSKEAAGTVEPTESYKRGQIEELISFANSNDLWIDFNNIPNNILYGIDGDLYFIDTQIKLRFQSY